MFVASFRFPLLDFALFTLFRRTRTMASSDPQSAACFFRQVKEGSPSGIWYAYPDCVGRRSPLMTICDSCVDRGLASLMGAWDKSSAPPFQVPL